MKNRNTFEKDSLEELKKLMDTPEYKAEKRRMMDEIFEFGETESAVQQMPRYYNPLTTRGFIEVYNAEHTDSRMSLSYISKYEGATDDNHRFLNLQRNEYIYNKKSSKRS